MRCGVISCREEVLQDENVVGIGQVEGGREGVNATATAIRGVVVRSHSLNHVGKNHLGVGFAGGATISERIFLTGQ